MSEQCFTMVLSTKPLQKLTGTDRQDRQAGRQAGRQADAQDYVLSQADALTNKMGLNCVEFSSQGASKRKRASYCYLKLFNSFSYFFMGRVL